MQIKTYLLEIIPTIREMAIGLVPGALGATVAVAVQSGLTWTQRLLQISIGIIVSYYANQASREIFEFGPMVSNSIGFVFGLGAFEAVKNLRLSLGELAKTAPRDMWEWWLSKWDVLFGSRNKK
jgi:hypothetical protein